MRDYTVHAKLSAHSSPTQLQTELRKRLGQPTFVITDDPRAISFRFAINAQDLWSAVLMIMVAVTDSGCDPLSLDIEETGRH